MGRAFLPVPIPRGYERKRLIDHYYECHGGKRKTSKSLEIEVLNSVREKIKAEQFNWLFISVWFGLRPLEIDNLKKSDHWKVEKLPTGRKILWVFQTKIVAIPMEDRWKPIPILFSEQEFALKMIETNHHKRPLMKTMKKYFGEGIDLYGGRKGFTDLMLSKKHLLENISIWMGHTTLSRTWRSYKNKRRFHL